jgi:hypothetical protein
MFIMFRIGNALVQVLVNPAQNHPNLPTQKCQGNTMGGYHRVSNFWYGLYSVFSNV